MTSMIDPSIQIKAAPPPPRGLYTSVIVHDGIAYVSGQVSREGDHVIQGPVSAKTSVDEINRAARACAANALSALDYEIGGLSCIDRLLFLRGFIAADSSFTEHSKVLDAVSEILLARLGGRGRHARSAVGVSSLPDGGLLEVEIVAALKR